MSKFVLRLCSKSNIIVKSEETASSFSSVAAFDYISETWEDLPVFLEFILTKEAHQDWLSYKIKIITPNRHKHSEQIFDAPSLLFASQPVNELLVLQDRLKKFLASPQKRFRFEPIEPNFELIIERHLQDYKLYFWFDTGNFLDNKYYTWDAWGLRMCIQESEIYKFCQDIQDYFEQ